MSLPTIIVTGGAGFIGSAVCRYLVTEKIANVVNIDALTYAANLSSLSSIEASESYHFVEADICDSAAMAEAFEKYQPDGVMHLAAESHVDRSITGAQAFIKTNVVGTSVILDVALNYWKELKESSPFKASGFKFLHVSTCLLYTSPSPRDQRGSRMPSSA